MKKIIYDLGASRGENLPYYLLKSELVIAVEANTDNCKFINKKFQKQISEKKLIVENCIVSTANNDYENFYLHKNYLLGQFPEPKKIELINSKK